MSLRFKIVLFTIAFLSTAVILGLGAFYIFNSLGSNLESLSHEIKKNSIYDESTEALADLVAAVEGWASKRNPAYKDSYEDALLRVRESTGKLEGLVSDKSTRMLLVSDLEEFLTMSGEIISADHPITDTETEKALLKLFAVQESTVFMRIREIHREWMGSTEDAVAEGERIRTNMTFYLIALITFSLISSGFLVILMRRLLGDPYSELLEATEEVASGDLGYRIRTGRKDEFGTIAKRFDAMVESLERSDIMMINRLTETELLLEITRIAGMTSELKEALDLMVNTIAPKMEKDICGVFLLKQSSKAFVLESCNVEDLTGKTQLPVDSEVSGMLLSNLKPLVIDDIKRHLELEPLRATAGLLLLVPIVRDNDCIGILLLGKKGPESFQEDEMDTATILAYTTGTAVKNIELYEATRKQLDQLRTVYELSKALTSVFIPNELLMTITGEITKLINARGCIIWLIEDGKLKVESLSGAIEELDKEAPVPIGKGIEGWVAKEGRPLFVEDVSKMPEETRTTVIEARSAITVPLKREEDIIGVLGLYDKLDEKGENISFSLDDLAVAEGFALISSLAIDKARMQEKELMTEAKILEANKRMELLFQSVQGGIITLDRSYTITSANTYVEKWIDRPLREIVSRSAIDLFHGNQGICPHCVAKATLELGEINSITQASGLNYAELTSYPIRDENGDVTEAVIFIQDITERVLYQEEIMGLYREVMQTKEYMESLIENSAEAIVTTDMEGVIKSWNPAAEAVYGFNRDEVIGKFLPFLPDSLIAFEKENIERIKKGEVLKLDTFRKRKDGSIIEVSLTLSPIKDVAGEIIGISGISKDISDKKRVEKELIRRNQELSRLFFISSAMRGTLDLDRLLRMVLTAVTMSDGLGFNRAILFLMEEDREVLRGVMGVGPDSPEEAWRVWEDLSTRDRTLRDIISTLEQGPLSKDSLFDRLSVGIEVSIDGDTALTRTVKEKTSFNLKGPKGDPLFDRILVEQLGTEAYAAVPLVSRDKVIGVLWVDNLFNRKPITDEDMKFMEGFSDQVASAIEAARLFRKVSLAEAELENIFRSISDMVYITDRDYTITNLNQAVVDRIGKPRDEIIGGKCYKVFHGMDSPLPSCPHHKTIETLRPSVEELEDPHLRGAFLTSTSPVFDSEKNFIGTVHVARDISEMKQLREKLQSAERMAALGEVAAKVAHEIRNPLVSVGGFAKRLENKLKGNQQEYARIIANEVIRLEAILKDILGFVKDVRVAKREVDFNEVVKGIVELLVDEFSLSNNEVNVQLYEPSVPMFIDPDRIKEALLNIITNANQATAGGRIDISTYMSNGDGVLEVTDTGSGIRQEDMIRIFDPFFTTRPTGTGLGLAIAKRIVEEHHGNITVASRAPGKGSSFIISLPLKGGKE
jgi:PAS domain S-box-containing protein